MPPRNLLIIALTAVVSIACYSAASKNKYANLFAEAMDVIDKQSLREIPPEKLFVTAMEGMLEDLDEHSIYISGDMFKVFDEDMKQEFGGVGMFVEKDPETENLIVLAPMPGTPAFEAGLKPGDQILTIDGVTTQGKPRREAVKMLRGPINEPVELTLSRGEEKFSRALTRSIIPVASAHGDYRTSEGGWKYVLKEQPRIGYIRLIQFGEKSTEEFQEALDRTRGDIDGLIIDLRNNTGGLLNVAIDICDMFLPQDLQIVSTKGRGKLVLQEFFSTAEMSLNPSVPICILINRNSASASEILGGCLQDHGRAVLIGEQSWGKGTVQNVIPIRRGESALKLTTASYWRPSGKGIDRYDELAKQTKVWGIQPDPGFEIEIEEEEVFENMRQRNLRDLRGLLTDEESEMISRLRVYEPPTDDENGDRETPEQTTEPESDGNTVQEQDTPEQNIDDKDSPKGPYVDKALQRAIDYFESLAKSKNQIAA